MLRPEGAIHLNRWVQFFVHPVSDVGSLRAVGGLLDEFKDRNYQALYPIVGSLGKVSTYTFFRILSVDILEVIPKSVLYS